MRKIWNIALIFIAISLHWTGASGQTVYKCGDGYSQAPCPGGTPVQASDSRTPQDKAQADANTARTAKAAQQLEKDRLAQEKKDLAANSRPTPAPVAAASAAKAPVGAADKGPEPARKPKQQTQQSEYEDAARG